LFGQYLNLYKDSEPHRLPEAIPTRLQATVNVRSLALGATQLDLPLVVIIQGKIFQVGGRAAAWTIALACSFPAGYVYLHHGPHLAAIGIIH